MADAVTVTEVVVAAHVAVATTDWPSAIHAAVDPLVDRGALEPRYAARCVSIVEEQGPYIVIAPGVALAHARPEDGAVQLALGVVTLATPVPFGHTTNDPVDVVFAFGSPDRNAHVGLLGALSRALLDGLADDLRGAATDDAAVALLKEVTRDVN